MAKDTRAETPAEEQAQPAPMPSAEQKVPEPAEAEAAAPKEETAKAEEVSEEKLELPEGVSERTRKQFEKLKRQLAEYRRRLFGEQVFREIRPEPAPTEPKTKQRRLYDPETGLVDVQALEELERRAIEAEERAKRAEEAVQRYIEGTQTREAYAAYPELNPESSNFDEDLYKTTRAYLLDSMAYPESYGGKTLTFKEAADLAKSRMKKEKETATEKKSETPSEAAKRLTPKEQASLEATGRPTPGVKRELSEIEEERLRLLTRLGDKAAMVKRMSRIPEKPASRSR